MKEIIKEHFILLLGSGLFTYGLFSFSSDRHCDIAGGIILPTIGSSGCLNPAPYYYYDQVSLILLTVGVILIVVGLLEMRNND